MIRKTMLAALMATALIPAAAGSRPVHVEPAAPTVITEAGNDDFAQDLEPATARLLYSTQGPLKASALSEPVARAAWKHKPSWYVLNREDRMLTPQLQSATARRIGARLHSVPASHVSMLSHPGEVADVILEAAGVKSAAPSPAKTGG